MRLADGRRLLDPRLLGQRDVDGAAGRDPVVPIHPDFRMWVLSNRPGFPFLGNDFFKECGDVFASHTIENPDTASELAMLRAYGPEVEEEVLRRLSAAFQDLRGLAHAGTLSYPYSTRELVSIVKHLQVSPVPLSLVACVCPVAFPSPLSLVAWSLLSPVSRCSHAALDSTFPTTGWWARWRTCLPSTPTTRTCGRH